MYGEALRPKPVLDLRDITKTSEAHILASK